MSTGNIIFKPLFQEFNGVDTSTLSAIEEPKSLELK
jgi:hypothetical protein